MNLPYSDNVVFFDTEFTTLDPSRGELLSIGLVSYKTGKKLYIEFDYDDKYLDPWVKKNVLPHLEGKTTTIKKARKRIEKFLEKSRDGKSKPYLVAYVNQFDAIYWYKLFGSAKQHPAYWIPIDFASILFAHGYSPNSMGKHKFFTNLGLNKEAYKGHNALEDALLLRDTYISFFENLDPTIK